jgi:hypothetical protein
VATSGRNSFVFKYFMGRNAFRIASYTDMIWGRCPINSAWFQELPKDSQVKVGYDKHFSRDLINKAERSFEGVKQGKFPSMVGRGPKVVDNEVEVPADAQSEYRLIGPPDHDLPRAPRE